MTEQDKRLATYSALGLGALAILWLLTRGGSSGQVSPAATTPGLSAPTFPIVSIPAVTSPTSPGTAGYTPPVVAIGVPAASTSGGVASPSPASSDGVTPPCGCPAGTGTTYYGSTAAQGSALAAAITSAMQGVQNLAAAAVPALNPPTASGSPATVAIQYGIVAPAAWGPFDAPNPYKMALDDAIQNITGRPVRETFH